MPFRLGRGTVTLCALFVVLAAMPAHAENPRVTMTFADRGVIVIELLPKAAPKTVAHFLALVKKHFYDGIKIHRLEPGFVAQMGDPVTKTLSVDQFDSNGAGTHGSATGGGSDSVPLEAGEHHARGTVGLARSQDPSSGDSQFYFNLGENTPLDNKYCVFGKIVKGLDVMDKLQKGDKIVTAKLGGPEKGKAAKGGKKKHAKS